MKLLIHCQTSIFVPLKFGNGCHLISLYWEHDYLSLLGSKLIFVSKRGPWRWWWSEVLWINEEITESHNGEPGNLPYRIFLWGITVHSHHCTQGHNTVWLVLWGMIQVTSFDGCFCPVLSSFLCMYDLVSLHELRAISAGSHSHQGMPNPMTQTHHNITTNTNFNV